MKPVSAAIILTAILSGPLSAETDPVSSTDPVNVVDPAGKKETAINPSETANTTETIGNETAQQTDDKTKQEVPLAKSLFESGLNYLSEGKRSLAREYFEKAASQSGDEYAIRAKFRLLQLRSSAGEENLKEAVEELPLEQRPRALFLTAEGWESYARMNPDATRFFALAEEYYLLLSRKHPDTDFGKRGVLQLTALYLKQNRSDSALDLLVQYLKEFGSAPTGSDPEKADHLSDRAWFLLGGILEMPGRNFDPPRALHCYRQVLKYPGSFYAARARSRISYLELHSRTRF